MRGLTPLRYLLPGLLLLLAMACGGDAEIDPTATSVAPTAAPFVAPTTERLLQESSASVWEILGLTSIRDVPVALERESPRLPSDEVADLWNQFIGGTVQIDNVSGRQFFETCSDGTGHYLDWWTPDISLSANGLAGESFTWVALKDRGGAWNTGKMEFTLDDPSLDPAPSATNFAFAREDGAWAFAFPGIEFVVFESPNCD